MNCLGICARSVSSDCSDLRTSDPRRSWSSRWGRSLTWIWKLSSLYVSVAQKQPLEKYVSVSVPQCSAVVRHSIKEYNAEMKSNGNKAK